MKNAALPTSPVAKEVPGEKDAGGVIAISVDDAASTSAVSKRPLLQYTFVAGIVSLWFFVAVFIGNRADL